MGDLEITRWLERLGLGRYAALFAENEIEREVLPDLTDEDLAKLGIPLGPRKKLLKTLASLASPETPPVSRRARRRPRARASARKRSGVS